MLPSPWPSATCRNCLSCAEKPDSLVMPARQKVKVPFLLGSALKASWTAAVSSAVGFGVVRPAQVLGGGVRETSQALLGPLAQSHEGRPRIRHIEPAKIRGAHCPGWEACLAFFLVLSSSFGHRWQCMQSFPGQGRLPSVTVPCERKALCHKGSVLARARFPKPCARFASAQVFRHKRSIRCIKIPLRRSCRSHLHVAWIRDLGCSPGIQLLALAEGTRLQMPI